MFSFCGLPVQMDVLLFRGPRVQSNNTYIHTDNKKKKKKKKQKKAGKNQAMNMVFFRFSFFQNESHDYHEGTPIKQKLALHPDPK